MGNKKWDQRIFEKTHLKFCKINLALDRRESNSAIAAELAKLPLQITLAKKILNTIHIYANIIVKQSYIMSKELALEKPKSYIFQLTENHFSEKTASDNADTADSMIASTIPLLTRNTENNYLQFWQEELATSKDPDFYRKFSQGFHKVLV